MNTEIKQRIAECLERHRGVHETTNLLRDCLNHIEQLEALLTESSDLLGEFAAFGNCDCDIPNGKTCEVCQAAMLQKRIKEALQPKDAHE